ncbi:MAG TPA: AMP-binding protein, partial [Anaerolineales bacterium]|nr:AMP-binding protein [Anaerolineales bacterium]
MPAETLLSRLLELHQRHPGRTAIIMQQAGQPDDPLSYDRLLHNAAGIAALLTTHTISPGEVVILVLQHGPALINSFYGALLHGAVPSIMPFLTEKLSPEKYQADIAALLGITRPAAILTEPAFLPLMQQIAGPDTSVRAVLDISACPSPPSPPHFTT